VSFDPEMNLVYMTGPNGWLTLNGYIKQADGQWQGSMSPTLAQGHFARHKVPLPNVDQAHVAAGYMPTVAHVTMTLGGRILAGATDLAAIAAGSQTVKTIIRLVDNDGVFV